MKAHDQCHSQSALYYQSHGNVVTRDLRDVLYRLEAWNILAQKYWLKPWYKLAGNFSSAKRIKHHWWQISRLTWERYKTNWPDYGIILHFLSWCRHQPHTVFRHRWVRKQHSCSLFLFHNGEFRENKLPVHTVSGRENNGAAVKRFCQTMRAVAEQPVYSFNLSPSTLTVYP